MKAQDDLIAGWVRLMAALTHLDGQPDPGPARARTIRETLTNYLAGLTANAEGKGTRCAKHPTEWAHACGPCRSEEIGRGHDDPAHKGQHLPEVSEDARKITDRILGETDYTEREHRI